MGVMPASVVNFQAKRNSNSLAYESELGFEQSAEVMAGEDHSASASSYQEGWIISYVDILTLLLTLFIILLAMSHFKPETSSLDHLQIQLTESEKQYPKPEQKPGNSIQISSIEDTQRILKPETPDERQSLVKTSLKIDPSDMLAKVPATKQNDQNSAEQKIIPTDNNVPQQSQNTASNELNLAINDTKLLHGQIEINKILPVNSSINPTPDENATKVENELYVLNADIAFTENHEQNVAPLSRQHNALLSQIENSQLLNKIDISEAKGQVNMIISDKLLFAQASEKLKPEGIELLKQIATMINNTKLNISVEGHTDNIPINNSLFHSNWELSTARATMVTRHLIENNITPDRIRVIGYADTQPRATNETSQGRESNRRVSIILHLPEENTRVDTLAGIKHLE